MVTSSADFKNMDFQFEKLEDKKPNQKNRLPEEDIAAIEQINVDCFASGMRWDSVAPLLNCNEFQVFLIRNNNKIVGILIYKVQVDDIHIWSLSVAKSFQKHGVGSQLMYKVMEVAVAQGLKLTLDAPPRNQFYYERFGFKVQRERWKSEYEMVDEAKKSYALHALFMTAPVANIKAILKENLVKGKQDKKIDVSKNKDDFTQTENGKKAIHAVLSLAKYARSQTSLWYSLCFRSKEKEASFNALQQELNIQLSTVNPRPEMNEERLAHIVITIIKNAMIVRGFGITSQRTTSAESLIRLLCNKQNENQENIKIINDLLKKQGINIAQYDNDYEGLRSVLFQQNNFMSTSPVSPYQYWGH